MNDGGAASFFLSQSDIGERYFEEVLKESDSLRVFMSHTPQVLGNSDLGKTVLREDYLADSYLAYRYLADTEQQADGDLGDRNRCNNYLTKTKKKPYPALGYGDQAYSELPYRDHAFSDAYLAILPSTNGDMDKWIPSILYPGLPFKSVLKSTPQYATSGSHNLLRFQNDQCYIVKLTAV